MCEYVCACTCIRARIIFCGGAENFKIRHWWVVSTQALSLAMKYLCVIFLSFIKKSVACFKKYFIILKTNFWCSLRKVSSREVIPLPPFSAMLCHCWGFTYLITSVSVYRLQLHSYSICAWCEILFIISLWTVTLYP